MSSINKVILLGRVGKDPEIRVFQNGGKIANFSVATSEKWKDKSTGEKKEKTEWSNVVISNPSLVENVIAKYVKKGSQIYIEGQLQTRKWVDSNGVDRYTTEVVVKQFSGQIVLLAGNDSSTQSEPTTERAYANKDVISVEPEDDLDDEIPF